MARGRGARKRLRTATSHTYTTEALEPRRFLDGSSTASLLDASVESSATPVTYGPMPATAAQTLNLDSGSHTYATLTDAVVTMTGRSELHITGTSSPIAGSIVHLNSPDAWLFMTNIKPSVVNATYLSQVRVSGAAAVHGSNVRIVQYGMGAVVIPHAPSYQPLQAFAGPQFTGAAQSFGQYTYYDTAGDLGVLHGDMSSFKLKRGYMATVATESDGGGHSKVYIAQDHDLDVSFLPAQLDNAVQFVRVFPWRWVSKKGSSDLSAATLGASWSYNWNNDQNSSLDHEYVPIRQQRWWPAYPTNKPDVTHLLGFNEPNNPVEDAYQTLDNGSVETALSVWPELLATGLRVGSPAVTDGGKAWLYEFMDKAIARNLRVDYIAIHNYQCGHSATSLQNWLKEVYDRYKLPIWLTEFNNGANWTTCADPTYEQNATAIGSFIDMMDSTPWIERYSVYSRVEWMRQMTYDEGGLTPAGQVYYNNASPIGYVQEPIDSTNSAGRGIAQLPFDGHTLDISGHGHNGHVTAAPTYVPGQRGQAIQLDGIHNHIQLPETVARGDAFSFAGWVYWDGGGNWQRIFDFGNGTSSYLFLTPSTGSNMRFAIKNGGGEQIVQTAPLPVGQWTHVAVTLGGSTARLYVNGALAATNSAVTIKPGDFDPALNYLGESQFAADPLFKGRLDDVLITDYALSAQQIAGLMGTNAPPQLSASAISRGPATRGAAFSGTVAGTATDADAGDSITYSKAHGPAWLTVAASGALSGTPTAADLNPQEFVITATDSSGASAAVVLTIQFAATEIAIAPATMTVGTNTTYQFTATGIDQFGIVQPHPPVTWSVISGGGSISSGGLYSAPAGAGAATIQAASGAATGTAAVTIVAPSEHRAWYLADEPAGSDALADNSGHNRTATLSGSASFVAGKFGNSLALAGGHASLPTAIVSGVTDFTIATWVKLDTLSTWSRIFDFGTGTSAHMFLTPQAGGTNRPRFAITTSGGSGEQRIDSNTTIAVGAWTHVAVTLSGNTGTLFINGVAVGTNTAITLRPSNLGSTTQNYIGKSQYPDPALQGSVDDFRIYGRALSASEVQALFAPPPPPTGSISGRSFHDKNGDGIFDAGDTPLSGATVFLDGNDNGAPDPGEPATLTDASGAYAFDDIAAGIYLVRQETASEFAVVNSATTASVPSGGTSAGNDFANARIVYHGTANSDDFSLRKNAAGQFEIRIDGALAYTVFAAVPSLTFNLGDGDADALMLDLAHGAPVPSGGITFDGGAGDSDRIAVVGTGAAENVLFDAAAVTIDGASANHSNVERATFDGNGGWDTLTVGGGPAVELPDAQQLQALALGGAGAVSVMAGGAAAIVARDLSIATTATLDLADNDLILDYTAAAAGQSLNDLQAYLAAGHNGGTWDGAGGIITSVPGAAAGLTALGIGDAASVFGMGEADTMAWSGQTLDATAFVIKYTYAGDANLDGLVSGDDYTAIDFGIAVPDASGWINGDFNYDGFISGDDYTVIDFGIAAQGEPLT